MPGSRRKELSFMMTGELPITANHRPHRSRPHLVTELHETKRLVDWNADNGLTFRLHPRILSPHMQLPYKPEKES